MEMKLKIIEFTSGVFSKPSQLTNIQIISLTTGTDILINIFKAITESETYKFKPSANIIKIGLYKNKVLLGKGEIDTTIHEIQKIKIIKEGSLKSDNSKITKESKDTSINTEDSETLDFDLTIHCFPAKKKICITPLVNKKKEDINFIRNSLMQKNLNKAAQGMMLNEKLKERFENYRNIGQIPSKTEINNTNTFNYSNKKSCQLSSSSLNFENDKNNNNVNVLENNDELLINNNELQISDKPLFKFQSQKKVKLSKFLKDNSMDASADNTLKNSFINSLNFNNNTERDVGNLNKSTVLNNNSKNHKLLASKEMEEQIMNQSFENEIINDNLILSKDEKIGIQDFCSGEIYFTNFFNLVDDFNMLYNKTNISNIPNIDIQLEFQLFLEKSLEIFGEYYKNWGLVNKQNKELFRYVKFYSSGEIQYTKLRNKLKTFVQKNKIKKRLNENDKIIIPNNALKINSIDTDIGFLNILENFTDISANFAKYVKSRKLKTKTNDDIINKIKLKTIYDKIMIKTRNGKKNNKINYSRSIHTVSSKYSTETENVNRRICNIRKGQYTKNTSGSANKEKKTFVKSKKFFDYSLNLNNTSFNCGYGAYLEKNDSKEKIKKTHKGSDINNYGNDIYATNNIVKKIMINNHLKKTFKNVKQ